MADFDLLDFQEAAARHILDRGGSGGLFLEMGCGKTRTALSIAHDLDAKRILVIAPLSVGAVWVREVGLTWPDLHAEACMRGTVKRRTAQIRSIAAQHERFMVIVNYESYWREPLRTAIRNLEFDMVIYDEAHRLAGRGSRQSRFAFVLAPVIPNRLVLTGTPMPNGPEDLFAVMRAVDPNLYGTRWAEFQDRYLRMGGFGGYQIIGYKNRARLEELLASASARVTKAEALSLPDQVDVIIPVMLSPKTRTIYDRLRRRAIADVEGFIENGELVTGTALSRNVLTNVLRLSQLTSGFVRTLEHDIVDVSTEKADTLKDLLDDVQKETSHVVVFCRFTRDVERVLELVHGAYRFDGKVSARKREETRLKWRAGGGVLVVQIAVSEGIELETANVCVFYSLDYRLINYLQARDRLHRIGQRNKVTYYHLLAQGTVDMEIYDTLGRKENLVTSVLDARRIAKLFS